MNVKQQRQQAGYFLVIEIALKLFGSDEEQRIFAPDDHMLALF